MQRTVIFALIILLPVCSACTAVDSTGTADPNAKLLANKMGVDEIRAEGLLAVLREAGLSGDISYVFPNSTCAHAQCYWVWEALICYEVALENNGIFEILREGSVIYPPSRTIAETTAAVPTFTVTSVTSPVTAGQTASVTVCGAPHASYTICVYYSSGISHAAGLVEKTADAAGVVSWQWRVGAGTKPGTYRIEISDGTATLETHFTVEARA